MVDNARADGDRSWLQNARLTLEWLHPKRGLDAPTWAREVVERAQAVNIDSLAFDFAHGGYAVFNDAVAAKDRHIGSADVIALLDEELHGRGMRLILMNMGAHCNSYASDEYHSWRVRDPAGEPTVGLRSYAMCLNSPYSGFLLQEIRGLLKRYCVDGLYIEGLYGLDCHCNYCRAEFFALFGRELPTGASVQAEDDEYIEFRSGVATDFVRRVRGLIDQESPRTVFIPCPSFWEGSFVDLRAWGKYADAVALERQWGFDRHERPLVEIGMSMQIVRAEAKRPAIGTLWSAWNVDRNYAPCGPSHYRLNFSEILLHGGTPQLHAQTLFEVEPTVMPVVKEMFDLEERLRSHLVGSEPVADVGLVVDFRGSQISPHFKGYYLALTEAHVPFVVVSTADLDSGDLRRYRALVLPNVERLSDDAMENLACYVRDGGGLVFSFRTGWRHPDGKRRHRFPLYDLAGLSGPFGVFSFASSASPHRLEMRYGLPEHEFGVLPQGYFRHRDPSVLDATAGTSLQSVQGSVVEVEPTTGVVWADLVDFDYSRMHRHHPMLGWYPGDPIAPLVLASESPGRCVYFAGELDRDAAEIGQAGTMRSLAGAARWAAGNVLTVEVACGATVEAAARRTFDGGSWVVLFVNHGTNQLAPRYVVREVEPAFNVRARLPRVHGIRRAWSLQGGEVTKNEDESGSEVVLARLAEFDAIVIELAS